MGWGLEIGVDRLRLCAATLVRGRVRVRRPAECDVPAGLVQPSLTAANLPDAPALGRLLRTLARGAGCRGWVNLALPDEVFSLRTLLTDEVPAEPGEARRFLRWQARDLLPFPPEEMRLDFLAPVPGPEGRRRVVCLIARDRVLGDYERLLQEAGLQPARVDARSVTLAQAVSRRIGARAVGLLGLRSGHMSLLLFEDGRPRFWRTISADAPVDGASDRLVREVSDSLAFCRESEGTRPIEELLLEGPATLLEPLSRALADWLEIPTSPLERGAFDFAAGSASLSEPARWGAAVGAAVSAC